MTSPAERIYNIMLANNIFQGGWTGYVGMLGQNNNSIAAINTGGRSPEVLVAIDYPTVQILGRGAKSGNSYAVLRSKMEEVKLLLHAINENPAKATAFPELVSCLVRGDITDMGVDDAQRPMMSLNFNLITSPTEVGNRDPN